MTLARLAALHGVATAYSPSPGVTVPVPDATVVAVLGALGVDAATAAALDASLAAAEEARAARLLPPTVVVWRGDEPAGCPRPLAALPAGTALRIALEDGGTAESPVPWAQLPPGVHALEAHAPDGRAARAALVVAPACAPRPSGPCHGVLVQLYSLLSARSWGMGDLGDLRELAGWAGRALGSGFVQVNPLHAAVPGTPTDPSPYRPSSRRFPDPVHLRIEEVPEFAYASGTARAELDALAGRAGELRDGVLRKGELIDRDAVWVLKRRALEVLAAVPLGPGRRAAFDAFRAERGRELEDHATWCALAERYGADRTRWPAGLDDPRSAATARARAELEDRLAFHRLAAWLTDEQLAAAARAAREAGMAVGIVHDLAVGVHPDGADAWAQAGTYARGVSVGAPPDAFNAHGQDWGLPPWRPDALAASGHAPYRSLLRSLFRHAGALRIDHVMGLFRLWWVPAGLPPTRGTYVRYDADAMLAVLVLEAHRAGAAVIGEDLGTVEPGVRDALRRRGVLGTSVLWFERDWEGTGRPLPPEAWRADCLATATTHDLPPTAARLSGEHVELRHRLGLLARPLEEELAEDAGDVAEWLAHLRGLGLLPPGAGRDEEAEVLAVYRFLRRTPARMTGVWLPDAVGDRRPQNLPGTSDRYPNWRLPVAGADGRPVTLEELAASSRLRALTAAPEPPGSPTAPPDARRG
ncbi:4-alpha-glucanotransferase [Streptomyces somaliensis]|uniref:4-alpha-glucanotransferase n=1 Tax=Streptomyces somaliensis (strain ATCC 33201 / DSM 40738 / JCM 12659 / KCTC 9044 / NCTC 11332 / NRRL B-12077 / IP 733) TaxID=1134445 RepID=A0AA44IE09_STRE0|nr:4-alpha-glucanotransferase [Streptomyces somaliensis]NKY14828.1 4-alpha-glucanotransferase [Streptomyces somaliensis DSM 40738]